MLLQDCFAESFSFAYECQGKFANFCKKKTPGSCWGEGTWMAQLVKFLTLGLGSGHGLTVCEIEPCIGLCADSLQPARDSLSLPFSAPPLLSFPLSKNK